MIWAYVKKSMCQDTEKRQNSGSGGRTFLHREKRAGFWLYFGVFWAWEEKKFRQGPKMEINAADMLSPGPGEAEKPARPWNALKALDKNYTVRYTRFVKEGIAHGKQRTDFGMCLRPVLPAWV